MKIEEIDGFHFTVTVKRTRFVPMDDFMTRRIKESLLEEIMENESDIENAKEEAEQWLNNDAKSAIEFVLRESKSFCQEEDKETLHHIDKTSRIMSEDESEWESSGVSEKRPILPNYPTRSREELRIEDLERENDDAFLKIQQLSEALVSLGYDPTQL